MKKKNISIIILGLLVPFVLNAQIDITKRTVTCDSVNARNDSIYLNGPVSDNGKPLPKIDSTVYWSDTTGANKTIATKHDLDTTYSAIGGNITLSQYQIAVGGADANSITGYSGFLFTGSTKTAAAFYTGTDDPTNSNRLNFDGEFHSRKMFTSSGLGSTIPLFTFNGDDNTGISYSSADVFVLTSGGSPVFSVSDEAARQSGAFYPGTTSPTNTGRLNYDGYLYMTGLRALSDNNAIAVYGGAYTGISGVGGKFETISGTSIQGLKYGALTADNNSPVFQLQRTNSGAYNLTGDIISIVDNPSTSTISGKIISATIGSTERISFNPRFIAGTGGNAFFIDTHEKLESNDTIWNVKNNGETLFSVDSNRTTVENDFINSPPFISLYRNTDTTLAAVVQNTWYKLSGLTQKYIQNLTLAKDSVHVEKIGNFCAKIIVSFSGNNGETWELGVFKNGVMELPDQSRYTSNNDTGNATCEVDFSCDGDDWISFKIRNITDTDVPTIKHIYIKIMTNYLE